VDQIKALSAMPGAIVILAAQAKPPARYGPHRKNWRWPCAATVNLSTFVQSVPGREKVFAADGFRSWSALGMRAIEQTLID